MKNGIRVHAHYLSDETLDELQGVTFAFISMDANPEKRAIVNHFEKMGLPFVEVGMGLHRTSKGLGGTIRAVLSTPENRDVVRPHIPLSNAVNDPVYTSNIQVSDLNSFNANMAIQLWKTHCGFYVDFGEPVWIHQIDCRTLIRAVA